MSNTNTIEVAQLQTIGVFAAVVLIVVLSVKKVTLGKVMCASTLVMALSSGFSFSGCANTIWSAFTNATTLNLVLSVMSIGLFSTIMNTTGYLDKMVQGLHGFLGNLKASIMIVPALIGSMPVLGGAAVSAPLVDKLGEGLHLPPDKKAAINLVFRHGMFFVFPFSPNLILLSNMIDMPVKTLISKLWPFGVVLWVTGYLFLLSKRSMGKTRAESDIAVSHDIEENRGQKFFEFLKYGSPLILALALSLVFNLPLWVSMGTGIIIGLTMAYFERAQLPSLDNLIRGANLSQAFAMLWIMAFKEFVIASPVFPSLVGYAQGLGFSPAVLALVLPLLFGYVSASQTTTLGVLDPILIPTAISQNAVLYLACIIYAAGFIAYFSSPLHLCQVLTCEYYKIDISKLYRLYWPILISVAALMVGYVFVAEAYM